MSDIKTIRKVELSDISSGKFSKHLADCVILTHDNKILMQQRPATWGTYAGALNIFGGHVEEGESVMQALIRELHEELGAQLYERDVIFIGAVSEEETNHTELVHIYFWKDANKTITGCYEAEDRRFDMLADVLAAPKLMDYARWALLEANARKLL